MHAHIHICICTNHTYIHRYIYTYIDTHTHKCIHTMCAVRSVRGGFIFRSWGPLQKACHGPARMSGHNCLLEPQTVCSPEGDHMNKMRGSTGRWQCRDLHDLTGRIDGNQQTQWWLRRSVENAEKYVDARAVVSWVIVAEAINSPLSHWLNKQRVTFHDQSCVIGPGIPKPVVLLNPGHHNSTQAPLSL